MRAAHPPPRQEVLALFSTFLAVDSEISWAWTEDTRLRHSMQLAQMVVPEIAQEGWARYWLKSWQTDASSLARGHLLAYLQEPCYWAAWKMLEWARRGTSSSQDRMADFFQIAITQSDTVLGKFNPQLGFSLEGYAFQAFKNKIRDEIQKSEVTPLSSDWSLLRQTSREQLTQALRRAGVSEEGLLRQILAWGCYQDLYVPTRPSRVRRLEGPDPATWQAIADAYNQSRLVHLHPPGPTRTPENIKHWLVSCAQALRAYRPRFTSLDAPRLEQEGLGEVLPAPTGSAFDELQRTEEQRYMVEINQILQQAVEQLPESKRELLDLYYGQGLGQQQIAQRLQKNQGTVSRQLTQCRGELVAILGQWSKETLHIVLTSNVIQSLGAVIDEWLEENYRPSPQYPWLQE
ncbi:sigma-70 family RNA polymerase sigma factor [Anthocerotibacter panamensis]|uniref:sigma-70 family RNA polymerase sigma factor n=1 Tax=Anthocerotibacter panamensis TaxID=2857077 RepID=UPI001C4033B9|nr:sigma-70 family RNA polymerase sigma factor [Anthocerotibacter panamensis]